MGIMRIIGVAQNFLGSRVVVGRIYAVDLDMWDP